MQWKDHLKLCYLLRDLLGLGQGISTAWQFSVTLILNSFIFSLIAAVFFCTYEGVKSLCVKHNVNSHTGVNMLAASCGEVVRI